MSRVTWMHTLVWICCLRRARYACAEYTKPHSRVGAAASGRCEGSTIMSVLHTASGVCHPLKTCSIKLTVDNKIM